MALLFQQISPEPAASNTSRANPFILGCGEGGGGGPSRPQIWHKNCARFRYTFMIETEKSNGEGNVRRGTCSTEAVCLVKFPSLAADGTNCAP